VWKASCMKPSYMSIPYQASSHSGLSGFAPSARIFRALRRCTLCTLFQCLFQSHCLISNPQLAHLRCFTIFKIITNMTNPAQRQRTRLTCKVSIDFSYYITTIWYKHVEYIWHTATSGKHLIWEEESPTLSLILGPHTQRQWGKQTWRTQPRDSGPD
jgi:hypothetical protein